MLRKRAHAPEELQDRVLHAPKYLLSAGISVIHRNQTETGKTPQFSFPKRESDERTLAHAGALLREDNRNQRATKPAARPCVRTGSVADRTKGKDGPWDRVSVSKASLDDLRRLYEERNVDYLRVATAVTGSVESGRDAVHDGFVGVVRSRNGFRGEGPLPGWVWRTVVNAALKRRRDEAPADELPIEAISEPVAGAAASGEQFLRYYADLDYDSIATAVEISPGTVGATLHAAHAALRRSLKEVPL
jgi:DNA-directed RNA polymerase specialized sigma24 family protein